MKISIENLGKKFNREWIFRNLTLEIESKSAWAITGHNGSGKSTLLKLLSTFSDPSEGDISYQKGSKSLDLKQVALSIGFAAPYVNLIEELTLKEHLDFHFTFKDPIISQADLMKRSGLEKAANKPVGEFSSGMKQRLKLSLAIFSDNELLILDEPTANMDENGIAWYKEEIVKLQNTRTILIASNQRYEYDFIENVLNITNHKPIPKLNR